MNKIVYLYFVKMKITIQSFMLAILATRLKLSDFLNNNKLVNDTFLPRNHQQNPDSKYE